jgi:asparagine synthase (glutamine-hydrolysing)
MGPRSQAELAEWVVSELRGQVALTLRGPTPMGVWLSGGVDSSALAAMVVEIQGGASTFSASFERPEWDESPYSRMVADHLGTDHHELKILESDALGGLEGLTAILDEPLADSSALACYLLAAYTRQHVKGILCGDGGDELFGGYPWHSGARPYSGNLRPFLDHGGWSIYSGEQRLELYREDLQTELSHRESWRALRLDESYLKRCAGPEAALYIDQRTYLRSDLLVKIDRTTMMHGLEARIPMLNHPFARRVNSFPQGSRLAGGPKGLLKLAMQPFLPAPIFNRSKQGFGIPLGLWIWKPGPLRTFVHELLLDPACHLWEYFEAAYVERLLKKHDELPSHGHHLWSLTVLELWLRNFHASTKTLLSRSSRSNSVTSAKACGAGTL